MLLYVLVRQPTDELFCFAHDPFQRITGAKARPPEEIYGHSTHTRKPAC